MSYLDCIIGKVSYSSSGQTLSDRPVAIVGIRGYPRLSSFPFAKYPNRSAEIVRIHCEIGQRVMHITEIFKKQKDLFKKIVNEVPKLEV